MYRLRRSASPSMQAKAPRSSATRSVTLPPSSRRRHSLVVGDATQMPCIASRQMPSGTAPSGNCAQLRRLESAPSLLMSNAVRQAPKVSATISVAPSGVMTQPLGNITFSAAQWTLPSGSTRMRTVAVGAAPPCRSKPKLPTQARPLPSTTMSLQWNVASSPRSACATNVPSISRRMSLRSCMDTTRRRPSGSQPRPEGSCSTRAMRSSWPLGVRAQTQPSCMSENQRRPSCQRGPSVKQKPSATTSTSVY